MVKLPTCRTGRLYACHSMIENTTNPTRNGRKRTALRARPLTCAVASLGLVVGLAAGTAPAGATTLPTPSPTATPVAPTNLLLSPGLPSAPPAPNLPAGDPIGGPLLGQTGVIVDPAAGGVPNVAAPSWVIADATTGKI